MSDFVHFMDINMNISTHSHAHPVFTLRESGRARALFALSSSSFCALTRRWHLVLRFNFNISTRWLMETAKRGAESGEERRRKRRMSWKVAKIDRAMLRQRLGWGWGGGKAREATSAASWSIYQSAREYLIIQDNSLRKSATCQRGRAL